MPEISIRKLAILAILAAPDERGVRAAPVLGTTRLQKLIFLLDRALPKVSSDRLLKIDLSFEPHRFGPADLKLYQDLEFMEALGHISRTPTQEAGERPGPEESTENSLSFGYLMGDDEEAGLLAEAENEVAQYSITPSGLELLDRLVDGAEGRARALCLQVLTEAEAVKKRYGAWPLQRLLRYVYSRYPELTTASEIRERVLGHP
jgi:hypothetical protein